MPGSFGDAYPGAHKDALKQTMLEHEATFKHQVFELHRLYTRQRDMMDEINRKDLQRHWIPMETSSSSSPLVSEIPYEDAWKWHKPNFPFGNSGSARPSVSVAENNSSPLSCTKGNGKLASRIPFQNGCSSKDCEILEVRPSKVRKKLFDLQLPADVYIDTEEGKQSPNYNISNISRNPLSRIQNIPFESSVKSNFGSVLKIDYDGDASRVGSCLRNSVGLADLNEPILVEEATVPTSIDFIGRGACPAEIKDVDLGAKPKSQFLLGLSNEILKNSQQGSNNGTSITPQVENKRKAREWSSYTYEAGQSKTHLNSFPQGLQPDKPLMSSQQMTTTLNAVHQPLDMLPSNYSRVDLWRERTYHGLELPERRSDFCSSNILEPTVASRGPKPYELVRTSDSNRAWSQSISTWGKSDISLTQKLTSSQTLRHSDALGTMCRSSQASAQSPDTSMEKWHLNSSSGSNPVYGSGLTHCNGVYHGSSSWSKDFSSRFSSTGFDYSNGNKDDKLASERSINYGARSYLKGSNGVDMKPVKDLNLNACSSIIEDRKCEGNLDVLPWLKAKPANKEGTSSRRDSNSSGLSFLRADSNQLSNSIENVKGTSQSQFLTQKITLPARDSEFRATGKEAGDYRVDAKILGFPILDNTCTPKKESSFVDSTTASIRRPSLYEDVKNGGKKGLIDINLACDPESGAQITAEVLVIEKGRDEQVANFRTLIDLNCCASEDEVTLAPSFESSSSVNVKIAVDINLEATPVPESEEDIMPQYNIEKPSEESVRIAAEAIVAISSSCHLDLVEEEAATCCPFEAPSGDSLLWFVEVVCSCGDDLESKFGTKSSGGDNELSNEFDYFEAMTLSLTEIKEDEYMPKPFVVETQKVEEDESVSPPNRSRRGQARRGRQRRDFQRDILPGLASLSRHEVTEDLQTFGGLMRAMGHSWNSGLNRRNGTRNGGAARGRRRSVVETTPAVAEITVCPTPLMQQLTTSFEAGLVDRSLTGWGKTPRRPRRQRCIPAGNLPSVALA